MNVMSVLNQLMQQAQSAQSTPAGNTDTGAGRPGPAGAPGMNVDLKSLLGGGALGLMLGSKRGRKLGGKALKYGALAGVGALAWKAYQDYQANARQVSSRQAPPQGEPLEQLQGQSQERRGLEILQAMIMAARADGHVDARERALLTTEIEKLDPDDELHHWIQQQFEAPLDAAALAASADSPQAQREIYLVSAIMVDEDNPMERAWLDQLGSSLGLEQGLTRQLEEQLRLSQQR
ncbi:tellurite resistance TerB family protein [Pseudohaliea sp.]|uniref:tellurite resistance TerB family protein n=1 Tax=Pseudohaliea sp. TaxID=2740289 RepID=UPI0032EC0AA4